MTDHPKPLRQRPFLRRDIGTPVQQWSQVGIVDGKNRPIHGMVNPRGYAMMHVINQERADGQWRDAYDQVILFENPGAVIVCTDASGRVGLIPHFRLVGDRPEDVLEGLRTPSGRCDYSRYVRTLRDGRLFDAVMDGLGEYVWELPRGLAAVSDAVDLPSFIRGVAAVEASEEAGFTISGAEIRGRVNGNPGFFPHPQYVVSARIERFGPARPESSESIGPMTMFSPERFRQMVDRDEIYDALTLAALAKAAWRF